MDTTPLKRLVSSFSCNYLTPKNSNKSAAKGKVRQNKSSQPNNKKQRSLNLGVIAKNTPLGSFQVQTGANFRTEVPAAYGQVDTLAGPQQSYDSQGNVRVKHREYLFDILSTTSPFLIQKVIIANPTVQESFPWLSGMANNFQKFCFERLCLHFVTQSPTSSPGSVMIVPIYDVDQDLPDTKSEALTFQDTTRSPSWQECCSLLPKSRLCGYKEYFTKIVQSDLKLSIPAKIAVATSGASDSSPITGEIWIEYDIKMSCPQRDTLGYDFFTLGPSHRTNLFPPPSEMVSTDSANSFNLGLRYLSNTISGLNSGRYYIAFQQSNDYPGDRFYTTTLSGASIVYEQYVPSPDVNTWNVIIVDVALGAVNPSILFTDTAGLVPDYTSTICTFQVIKVK